MEFTSRMAHLWAIAALAAYTWNMAAVGATSIPLKYCANVNTASSSAGNQSIYQSDGLCRDFCHDRSKAFAILQDKTCWCGNNAPDEGAQKDLSSCTQQCPGFPSDICGGSGGLFVYLESGGSSQDGGSGSSQSTGQGSAAATTTSVTRSPSSSHSTSSTSSSTVTTPVTPSVETVTESGTVRTVTVTPTPGVSSSEQGTISSQGGGLGTGAAVGIAVGIIAVLVAMGIVAFCVWRRKKNRQAAAMFGSPSPRGSSSGMMSSTKAAEAGATPPYIGRPADGNWETDGSTKRRSTLMPIDPRIDPAHSGIYNRHENISHDSINTLRDDQDYSRRVHQPTKVLRATNPDPEMAD